jgi:hypothetical protein
VLRFQDLRTENIRKVVKITMGGGSKIDTLVLDINERQCE